ncbi:hypothetical protein SAMN00777080_0337 [Aquiflexum balticum DSM 16537]|uniref:Por secretion system C-terminal sorting domain-containing protein n=1 Tax=Aquiflexum balticum DSM 16537 TaxID=758820 RepID=A0A1W2H000_9BACT|nr:hypothetical protein [Aquiflexum balticum]SMD41806.1 hypothetical protein SAMN00777080_0337 [Aquiflexum balticum DSM 16537]
MKFFKFIFLFHLLLFGVALKSSGQNDCEECKPVKNQRDNFVIQEAYLSDSLGVRSTAQECNSSGAVSEFWITLNYTSRQDLDNVKLLFDLFINNASGTRVDSLNIEYFVGSVVSTGPGQQNTVTIQIDLGSDTFNCSNQVLELFNARAFWTANDNLNPNGQCDGYAPGLCSNPPLIIIPVGVDGFIYDFDYVIDCVEENDNSIDITFFVTTLAGGARPAVIDWSFDVNGDIITELNGGFSYTLSNLNPLDVIIPGLLINKDSSDNSFTISSSIIVPALFNIESTTTDSDPNISSVPNGSIVIDSIDPIGDEYLYFWTDEDGNILNPADPRNLTGLDGGLYTLTMVNQTTGVCITYDFPLNVVPLPVLFGEMSLIFISPNRTIEFNWTTTKEWESSHFEIERAIQGIQFEKIGEVKSFGWSDSEVKYAFEDRQLPLTGGNILYRLKQVNMDGGYDYSKTLSVGIPGMEFTPGVWRAYPNPTDGNVLHINLLDPQQYKNEPITFRLIHPTAITESITVSNENEMNEILASKVPKMPKGLFVIEIRWGQKVEHIKVLK